MPRLTVIIPFYDETAYLRSALNSVAAQPVADTQILVVNDNPDRFSPRDLEDLTDGHRVELIHHPRNLGLSAARNSGLARARGDLVAFLDADDYFVQDGLAAQLSTAEATGADITHAATYFTPRGSPDPRLLPRDAALFHHSRTAPGLLGAEEAQFITSSWSSLYRRDFLDRHGLRFDPDQPRFEDRLFVLHTVTRADTIAFLGAPTRVWRGRGGSISVTRTTPETHLLQLQLLEKSLAHIRAEVTAGRLPQRFEKRELFNTVSRLIWDMDLIDAILADTDPAYRDMAPRIPALLGQDSFSHAIFDDPVLARISRIGMTTRKGRVSRRAFFTIHKALREGDFPTVAALTGAKPPLPLPRRPRPRLSPARLILHLGLHKTGSTHVQHHLARHRDALRDRGVLVPRTGFDTGAEPLRDGACMGHQGLAAALDEDRSPIWDDLAREIRASGCGTVVLSCENLLQPTRPDRAARLQDLADRLGFDRVAPVALVRRPDSWAEAFYRETVINGMRGGGRGIGAFLVDHGPTLLDFPALFGPIEDAFGTRLRLADFDAAKSGLWPAFAALAGLPADLPALELPRYATPDRDTVLLLELLNRIVAQPDRRRAILRAWFAQRNASRADHSLLPAAARLRLIDDWVERSAAYAAARGYAPDLDAIRASVPAAWTPPETIPAEMLADLFDAVAMADTPAPSRPAPARHRHPGQLKLTLRLRPWAARFVHRTLG